MRTRRRATIEDLRRAVACLPRATRTAMLEGVRNNEIIVGAYAHGGGICPMLAAHREGGRTSMISFARAWDRFAFREARGTGPRRATARELRVLVAALETSLLAEDAPDCDLAAAIASHEQLVAARTQRSRPGDPDRSYDLRARGGWSWAALARTYDEYEQVLWRLRGAPANSRSRERVLA